MLSLVTKPLTCPCTNWDFFQVHGRYFRSDDLLDDTNDFCGCWRESKLCSMDESPGP